MTPEYAYTECFRNNKRNLELEHIVMTSADWSFFYAKNIIHGRFFKAENVIAINPELAYYYATDIIDGPFLLAHDFIFKNNIWGNLYIKFLLKKKYVDHSIIEWLI